MDDYIKRSDALKLICSECVRDSATSEHCGVPCYEYEKMKMLPAADVVEVVRCKDCKHCHLMFDKSLLCWNCNSSVNFPISADDFCCHGERRTEDG